MRISCGAGWVGVVVLVASCEAGSLGGSTSSVTVAGGRAVDLCGTWKGVELEASRSYSPSKWFDASHTFCQMIDVPVPASIDVAKGSSANQFATLTLSSSATGNAM